MTTAADTQPSDTASRAGVLGDFGSDAHGLPTPERPLTLEEARRYVAALATSRYENFSVLSRLVPGELRADFAAVYGFCRWSDDLADETGDGEAARRESQRLLAWWRSELRECFRFARREVGAEAPRHPVFLALAETARRRELAEEPFHHLLDAFEQDQRVTRYRTWEELLGYCRGSANPVGRIVLALAGHRGDGPGDEDRLRMSDATCSALQLTNFWQDVRRDLIERDRIYLPSEETGLDDRTLRWMLDRPDDPEARVHFIREVRPLAQRTRELFREGRPLPRTLDRGIRPVVWLFGAGGEAVLNRIERMGCATLWERPTLSRARKAWLVGVASAGAALAGARRTPLDSPS